jgi:hypothetical protein
MGEVDDDTERLCAADELTSSWGSDLSLDRSDRCREWQAPGRNKSERRSSICSIDPTRHAEMQLSLYAIDQDLMLGVGIESSHL